MRLVTQYFVLAFSGLALGLHAQTNGLVATTNETRMLSRDDCIRLTLEHNLSIRIERYNPQRQMYTLKGSYSYYEPQFSVSGGHSYQEDENNILAVPPLPSNVQESDYINGGLSGRLPGAGTSYELRSGFSHITGNTGLLPRDSYSGSVQALSLRQPLLKNFWIDAGRALIQISKKDLKISEYALQYQVMDIVSQVQQAYYDLVASRDAVRVAEKAVELKEQLLAETKKRVQVGVATPLDEKQVESELATAMATLSEGRRLQSVQETLLRTYITDDYGAWYHIKPVPTEQLVAVPEVYDLNESWLKGIALRPDYVMIKTELERQGVEVKLQKNQIWPQLDIVGSYGRSGIDNTGSWNGMWDDIANERNPRYSVGGMVTIPLGNRDARYRLKSAKAAEEQIKDRLRLKHMNVLTQIENSMKTAKSKYEQLASYRDARVFAEAAYQAELKKLENGKSTSYFVLDFQNRLIRAQADEIRALADYNKALINLYFDEGTTLERNRISIEFK